MTGQPSEAANVYLRLKALFGGTSAARTVSVRRRTDEVGKSLPFGAGREPRGLGELVDALTTELGWESALEKSELIAAWPELVGPDTAQRAVPVGIEGGLLTVRCSSTAWTTQLRLMRAELLARIAERYPEAGVESIRFEGPDVPSWKKGPRSVPGRGPRDTYG